MNAIRCTIYPPTPSGVPESYKPFTTVIREGDLREDLTLAEASMQFVEHADEQGVFCVTETFDAPDDATIEAVTMLAIQNILAPREEAERYMACLYQFEAAAFPLTGATLMGTVPAPISVEDCASTLRRLGRHPDYNDHRVMMRTIDGYIVVLEHGDVTFRKIG